MNETSALKGSTETAPCPVCQVPTLMGSWWEPCVQFLCVNCLARVGTSEPVDP